MDGSNLHFAKTLDLFESAAELHRYDKIYVLVDTNTAQHCWPKLAIESPRLAEAEILEIPNGEEHKTIEIANHLWNALAETEASRKSLIINLGGGVVTDLGGFVAATYKRGIHFINIPTTLLAQVDAALGGKTGVDLGVLKNLVGTFSPAQLVFVCPEFLKTLPAREIKSGAAEMIKHALINDKKSWREFLEMDDLDEQSLSLMVESSAGVKSDIVARDPLEQGERKKLNYGHTIGHAIESYALEKKPGLLLHGEAIALGILGENEIAVKLGLMKTADQAEIENFILRHYEISKEAIPQLETCWQLMQNDKKNDAGTVYASLVVEPGLCKVHIPISKDNTASALSYLQRLAC